VVVSGATDRLTYRTMEGIEFERRGELMVWEARNSEAFRQEPYADLPSSYLPTLIVGDSTTDWDKLGAEYLETISDTLMPDPAVTEIAEKLLRGIDDPKVRIRRLVEYVQSDFEYQAIVFGRRAWKPNMPAKIISKKFGDCKDHSLLLYHLLRDRGIEARLALANTADIVEPDIPSLDQFNHMIVYLPDGGAGRFVDTTDKSNDVIELPPVSLGGRLALVLDEKRSELKRIPEYPRDSHLISSRSRVSIDTDGRLTINENLELSGYASIYFRASLKYLDGRSQQEFVQTVLTGWMPTAQIEEFSIDNLEQASSPLLLKLKYSISGRMSVEQGKMRGRAPLSWERWLLHAPHLDRRYSPMVFYPAKYLREIVIIFA